jgi:kynurenine 3-monooxygenase
MTVRADRHVVIVGAGLVGSLLACYLGRRGYAVDVHERRPDPRLASSERGRSINLALSERGIDALRRVGLVDSVMAPALPMHGRIMHGRDSSLAFQSYSADGSRAINSIGRAALNETLLDAAESTGGVRLHFNSRLAALDLDNQTATFDVGDEEMSIRYEALIGADGGGSAVRTVLVDAGLVKVTEDLLDAGYKELHIPARDGDFALDPDALHIWPRGGSMMIALPNPDKSFTCTLFWPKADLTRLESPAEILDHFTAEYPDAVPLMPTLVEDFQHNPVGLLGTIHTDPWQVQGSVSLIGDSAHAIVPFFGQGANSGFEDVVELDRCLQESGDDWSRALPAYQERRQDNARAIAQMAQENFVEMRDRVGSRVFLATKKFEHALERALPGTYLSRYEMVSFTTIPYAEVLQRDARQRRVVVASLGIAALGLIAVAAGAAHKISSRS